MRVSRNKKEGRVTYTYKGDLQQEVDRCYKELLKKQESLPILEEIFAKAKKERESCLNRISDLSNFLRLCKQDEGVEPRLEGLKG